MLQSANTTGLLFNVVFICMDLLFWGWYLSKKEYQQKLEKMLLKKEWYEISRQTVTEDKEETLKKMVITAKKNTVFSFCISICFTSICVVYFLYYIIN